MSGFPEHQAAPEDDVPVHDMIGVGFGPSNLALAIAIREDSARRQEAPVSARFLERQPGFGWHRGMLIDDATMQVSFLKDLVTLRNPASEFSFLSYLHSKGRLVEFINSKNLFPLRVEFHDYLEWAAAQLGEQVDYQHEVLRVDPVLRDGAVRSFDVVSRRGGQGGEIVRHRTRNLVLSTGLAPALPDGIEECERIWHNHHLLHRVGEIDKSSVNRVTVVGAGQSAAEVTAFLHTRFPRAEVCAVFSRYGYSPSDDSPFANQVFDPDAVDTFYLAPDEVKDLIMGYHGNTNYSVVDLELINDLYRRLYQERVLGTERLRILNVSCLREVVETDHGVRVTTESLATGEKTVLDSDLLVYATGYRPMDPLPLLGTFAPYCCLDAQGRVRVERDYRLTTQPPQDVGVYLQGGTEHTHGITSSLLSNGAIRSAEILDSILARRAGAAPVTTPFAVSGARSA